MVRTNGIFANHQRLGGEGGRFLVFSLTKANPMAKLVIVDVETLANHLNVLKVGYRRSRRAFLWSYHNLGFRCNKTHHRSSPMLTTCSPLALSTRVCMYSYFCSYDIRNGPLLSGDAHEFLQHLRQAVEGCADLRVVSAQLLLFYGKGAPEHKLRFVAVSLLVTHREGLIG